MMIRHQEELLFRRLTIGEQFLDRDATLLKLQRRLTLALLLEL